MTGESGPRRAYALGTRRGIAACASERGTFAVLALDHRQNLRRELRPADPVSVTYDEMVEFKRAVVRALAPVATGTLLDPEIGAAQCIADGSLPASAGLLVAIEATGYDGPSTARISRVLHGWSVEKAKRMGASAAKLLVYYHPDAPNAANQERLVGDVARDCLAADIALFVEPLSFSITEGETLTGEARRRVVVETARRLTAIGGDILKAEFPYDPSVTDRDRWREACAELDAASVLPWVLLSAGVDEATFEAQVSTACEAGASGVVVGRAVWAEAATMEPAARDAFLATTGRERLRRLADLVDGRGRPWQDRPNRLTNAPPPGDGWYREY
ncbi:MAG TPA: tagatose 1,6-diphosphate aldolase [Candidatus Limnocylindrales bacterium]|nr:tagatose 1,6-diphosphate aldolase [Candidatus Limnocylindrales bacterium]